MGLNYSLDASINRIIFLSSQNDVNFFVEDEDKEFEYEVILKNLFGSSIKINNIFAVGGKPKLIEAYEILKNYITDTINVLIADRDFDYVLDKPMVADEKFIYLKQYCIENYLIDEHATTCFIQGRLCKLEDEVKKTVNFDTWFNNITNQFYELFILFLIVQKNGLGIPNSGESTFKFLYDNGWEVDPAKVNRYYDDLKNNLPDLDEQIRTMKAEVKRKIGLNPSALISGKFYLDSLKQYLRTFSGNAINDKDLRMTLIRQFDVSKLDFIKDIVISLKIKNQKVS